MAKQADPELQETYSGNPLEHALEHPKIVEHNGLPTDITHKRLEVAPGTRDRYTLGISIVWHLEEEVARGTKTKDCGVDTSLPLSDAYHLPDVESRARKVAGADPLALAPQKRPEESLGSIGREEPIRDLDRMEGGRADMPLRPLSEREREELATLADPSKWSPVLREIIEQLTAEGSKEVAIPVATDSRPSVVLGEGLPPQAVKYFAESADFD